MLRRQRALPVTTASDSLFRALDGHVIAHRGGQWRFTVCGIFADSTHRWVQLRLAGTSRELLTIRLTVTATVSEYCAAVADWLDDACDSDHAVVSYAARLGSSSDAPTRSLRLVR